MGELAERIENNFINIYSKFDILDKKLNNYHMKFHKINEMIDIIISDEYSKIYKTYYPMKNYDLVRDQFFINNAVIDIPLKANTYIIFKYIFESEYINIPLVINLKIDDVLEKDFNIHLKKHNEVRHMFKLDYNITTINFYLYLFNNEIYNDDKMEYLKKILFNNKKIKFNIFSFIYMNYYRKTVNNTANDVKLKMQIGALTVKITENINKINYLLEVDKNIKKDIVNNSNKIVSMNESITNNFNRISINDKNIKFKIDTINSNIDEIKSTLTNVKNDLSDFKVNENVANYSIQNFFIYDIDVENDYTLNKDNPKFFIFTYTLEDDFKVDSVLEINCKLLYDYTTYNNIGSLMHIFRLYNENNVLIHEYKNLKCTSGDNLKDDLNHIDLFYVKLNNDYSVIKIELILSILDTVTKSISCKLYNSLSSNFLCIKYIKKN